ncbi:MAG TPA: lysophospholipid acyltransferase family protein [Thermoanaerobaculia bacterium]|nr:lysophospholipid acyltransferase family protein [Thermoanaerobaculia bacterium]
MRARVVGFLLFVGVGLYRATLRIRLVGAENREAAGDRGRRPVLHAIWHQRMLLGILRFPFTRTVTMASRSKDGEVIARFLGFWGFRAVRGSSSRGGGPALKEMIELLKGTGGWAALTPDGPRGPARRSKAGIAYLSAAVGAPALPVGASARRARFLRSWDRYLVPLPFSSCAVVFGPPVEKTEGESDEAFLRRLDAAIDEATDEADRLCGVVNAPRERERPPAEPSAAAASDEEDE